MQLFSSFCENKQRSGKVMFPHFVQSKAGILKWKKRKHNVPDIQINQRADVEENAALTTSMGYIFWCFLCLIFNTFAAHGFRSIA